MRKQFLAMAAVLALSAGSAYATSSVCVSEDGEDANGNPTCTVTCCDEVLTLDGSNPPSEPPAPPEDPTALLCGSAVITDGEGNSIFVAGSIDPEGTPPDPAGEDPSEQGLINGCIAVGPANTSDLIGDMDCEGEAVAACEAGGCAHSTTVAGACPDEGDGGGGDPGLPELPGGDVPELPAP